MRRRPGNVLNLQIGKSGTVITMVKVITNLGIQFEEPRT